MINQEIACYKNVAACDVLYIEKWEKVYFAILKGEGATLIPKKVIDLPIINPGLLRELHYGFSWQREQTKKKINKLIADHNNFVTFCKRKRYSLNCTEYGWEVEGIYFSVFSHRLEEELQNQKNPGNATAKLRD